MALVRWNPASELQREIDSMVNTFWGDYGRRRQPRTTSWWPLLDVYEAEDRYFIYAELPGMNREDFNVSLQENVLTLSGEKKAPYSTGEGTFHGERHFGSFSRSFTLGADVQPDAITATYKDGVLTLEVPKAEEAKPRQIDIQVE